jgi:hypothetical protein
MLLMSLRLLVCLSLILHSIHAAAQQNTGPDAASFTSAYANILGLNARLYNGPEYQDYSNGVKEGIPYFDSKNYLPGSIVFDSIFYPDVQLRLDLVYEYLTILHPPSFVSIQLPNKSVSSFEIGGHQFIHLLPDSLSVIKEGFYERLYSGKSAVFVRHRKTLEDQNKSDDIYRAAVSHNTYHIYSGGQWYNVKSARGLISVFKGKEKLVQQHLRKQRLKFRKNPEPAMVEAAKFYDQLTN